MLQSQGFPSLPLCTNATASYLSLIFDLSVLPFSFVGVPGILNGW